MKPIIYGILGLLAIPLIYLMLMHHENPVFLVIGTIELVLIGVAVNGFVIVYFRRRWRVNPYGRALMYSKVSLAILVDLSLITALIGPDWQFRSIIRIFLFGAILFAQARLFHLLLSLPTPAGLKEPQQNEIGA